MNLRTAFRNGAALALFVGSLGAGQGCGGEVKKDVSHDDEFVYIADIRANEEGAVAAEIVEVLEKQGIICVCEGDAGLADVAVRRREALRALQILASHKERLKSRGATLIEWKDVVTQEGRPLDSGSTPNPAHLPSRP